MTTSSNAPSNRSGRRAAVGRYRPSVGDADLRHSRSLQPHRSLVAVTDTPDVAEAGALSGYMKPADLVAFLDHTVTEGTLRNWRCNRNGPPYITIGRAILYPTDAVHAWIEEKKQAALDSWPRQA